MYMKKSISVLLMGVLFCLLSCSVPYSYPEPMHQAKSCIDSCPDSALIYLAVLEDKIKEESRETQMYYHLLTIKAKDKLYISHTSDSLINLIVDFYQNYGDPEKLVEAYYYRGRVYRDMYDAPRALKCFQQVADFEEVASSMDLLGKTYNQMGALFAQQGLYDESLEINWRSVRYYLQQDESSRISYALRDIARMYDVKKQQDSALYYYETAYQNALDGESYERAYTILGELGCYYYKLGEIEKAKSTLLRAISKKDDMGNVYLKLSTIYKELHQWDSAYYYFDETLKHGEIWQLCSGYRNLFHLEMERKDYSRAIEHVCNHLALKDSLDTIIRTEEVAKIHSLYNYQHTEEENVQLKLNAERHKTAIYKLILLFVILIVLITATSFFLQQRKKQAIEKERRLRLVKEQLHAQSLSALADNERRLHDLVQQLHEATEESNTLQMQLIQTQKELLESKARKIQAVRDEQELLRSSFEKSDIYLTFHKACNDPTVKITESHWQELQFSIDSAYANFTDRLYTLHPQLTPMELRVCCLIKISMPVREIAELVNRSRSSISLCRSRLFKKIHGREGTSEEFDQFLVDL